jgi:hypothetical protein
MKDDSKWYRGFFLRVNGQRFFVLTCICRAPHLRSRYEALLLSLSFRPAVECSHQSDMHSSIRLEWSFD